MKTLKFQLSNLIMLSLMTFMQLSCSDESNIDFVNSTDFEIFLTKNQISYNSLFDYSKINLDTIDLSDTPFLTMDDIESYDTVNHIINLKKSKDNLDFPSYGVFGQMFVVTVDKVPIYCGFFWSIMSSVPCNWIFIEDTIELNGLTDDQIQISAGYPNLSHFHGIDPRNDSMITDVFSQNGTLTGNTKVSGNGLNFYVVIKSKYDTSGLKLNSPINALGLEAKPFIAYNEIQSYDTSKHILELTINHDSIENRVSGFGKQFVVSLDDERQYSGLLVPITSSMIYPTITIIQPYFDLDSLKLNQIHVGLGYPNEKYFDGEDLRLTKNIVNRLKLDNKLK
jgi:hypothetical protein